MQIRRGRERHEIRRAVRKSGGQVDRQQALAPRLTGQQLLKAAKGARGRTQRDRGASMAGRAASWTRRLCHRLRGTAADGQDRVAGDRSRRRPCRPTRQPGGQYIAPAPKTTLRSWNVRRCCAAPKSFAGEFSIRDATLRQPYQASGALCAEDFGHGGGTSFRDPRTYRKIPIADRQTDGHESMYRRAMTGGTASPEAVRVGQVVVKADLVILTVLPRVTRRARVPCSAGPAARQRTCAQIRIAWQLGRSESPSTHGRGEFPGRGGMGRRPQSTARAAMQADPAVRFRGTSRSRRRGGGVDPFFFLFRFCREGQPPRRRVVSSSVGATEYGQGRHGGFARGGDLKYRCDDGLVRAAEAVV